MVHLTSYHQNFKNFDQIWMKFWFFWLNFIRFWWILKSWFLKEFGDKIGKMLECEIFSKMMKFKDFLMNFIAISIFWWRNFEKILRFLQNHDFQVSQFCDQVVKFVWQVWSHLVNLTIVTHSQTSPSERSHSSDMISWKNRLQTHHIDLQNVETKSGPKISWNVSRESF